MGEKEEEAQPPPPQKFRVRSYKFKVLLGEVGGATGTE
jgi:hypothetical protein